MEQCPSSHHKTSDAVQALQCFVCSLRLRQLLSVPFPGHLPKRGKGARSVSSQETFPQGIRVNGKEQLTSRVLGIRKRSRIGRKNGRTLTSFAVPSCPAFGDQVTYTRGFRAALSAANSSQSSGLVMLLMRSRSPRPGCLGRILQVSLGIHQH